MIGSGQPRAFTLIGLLIVVAIIAILALIAVPNFLEAQTRAKVARVRADLRAIATAIEGAALTGDGAEWWHDPNDPMEPVDPGCTLEKCRGRSMGYPAPVGAAPRPHV